MEVGKMRFNFVILFLLLTTIASAIPLNEVRGIKKLSNYNELKDIEVERIVDRSKIKRNENENRVYVIGENKPFTGSAIMGLNGNRNIEGIYFYENGHLARTTYEYYSNGQLQIF